MKITQIADYFDARTGNPLAIFARVLAERGHEITVLASSINEKPMDGDARELKGARVRRFRALRIGTKAFSPGLFLEILFSKDLGIVHGHVLGFFSLFACALLKPLKKYRLVVTPDFDARTPDASFPKTILVELMMKMPLQRADLVLPFTELERQELHRRFGIPLEKMRVLPIGINYEMFQGKPKSDYRKELGLEKKFVLLSVCFLHRKKNLEAVLEALKLLPERVVLVHAGGFPDAEYKSELDSLIDKNGLGKRVFFLGNKSLEELADAYKCADAFVQPGFRESYSIPVIEAMTAGLPVITTRTGIAAEAVKEPENGFFANDAIEIGKAVKTLISSDREKISIANRRKAMGFDWKEIIKKLEGYYSSMQAEKPF